MKSAFRISLIFLVLVINFSCAKDDEIIQQPVVTVIDYSVQYTEDITRIEEYLQTHSATVTNHEGFADDQNVVYTTVPMFDSTSIWGSNPLIPKSNLLTKTKVLGKVEYKIYYLMFREGSGSSPAEASAVKTYFKGFLLDDTVFQTTVNEGLNINLNDAIVGWEIMLPEFKMGTVTGLNQYNDFGAGAIFLPSALCYYEKNIGTVPAYSPLIFNIKLYNVLY